jgi:HK97 family phage major capsid protein/HK97 family phage prohead protease
VNRRAFALLDIKSVNEDQRIITGIATSATADLMDDVVEPAGAQFKLPIPLLWQHDGKQPIGEVYAARVTDAGIEIKARLAKTDEPGPLKTRLDDAWQSIKIGLVKGLSIGFKSLEESYDKTTGGYHFLKWLWLELSAVTIPANTDASIVSIKAASGRSSSPGASGSSRVVTTRRTLPMKKSYADMIADCLASRKEKTDRIDALLTKSGDAGVTLDAAEEEEHDTLAQDVDTIDKQLVRYRAAEAREKESLQTIGGRQAPASGDGLALRPAAPISVTDPIAKLGKGIMFARYAMCMGMSRGNPYEAKQLAQDNYGDGTAPVLVKMIEFQTKGAVGGANTQTAGWASELVPYTLMDDFIQFLRPGTIVGKFGTTVDMGGSAGSVTYPALVRVPFNTRVSGFSAGLTANWVGEGLPILLSKATSFTTSLTWAKVAALAVLTKEEIRFSNPSAEAKVRDEIARCMIAKLDKDFIDPAKSASANVSPASVTNQTTPILTTGVTAATLRTDLATLIATFATAKISPASIVLIMNTSDALNVSLMITSLGNPVFPGLTMNGGYLLGFPVITTEALTTIGSPTSNIIVAVAASEVYLADDGVVTVDASDQASVEMVDSSSQSGITGTGASLVSFWQDGLVGLKATREITWKIRRTGAARYIYNSAYKA